MTKLPPHSDTDQLDRPSGDGGSQCLISFGSNLGDRHELIAEAARKVAAANCVSDHGGLKTSRLFETPPIGGPGGQEPFLNAVGAFDTIASAREILSLLQTLENELGRQRRRRWDARSIDLDVVLHGQLVGGGTGLIVPHPRYTARQFVLQPARDVAPHYRDPRFGWTLERLAEHLSAGSPSIALVGGEQQTRAELCRRLTEEHGIRTFAASPIPEPMNVIGNAPSPAPRLPGNAGSESSQEKRATIGEPIDVKPSEPWVSAYVPELPALDSEETNSARMPRLVARIQRTNIQQSNEETQWPAPHQMWPAGWQWPEYRLEVSDIDWAVTELVSALESMRCPAVPVTENGDWW